MEKIDGVVERIVFSSQQGDFSVFRVQKLPEGQSVTMTIHTPPPLIGQEFTAHGEWIEHPRFGPQFKVTTMTTRKPNSTQAIEKFLSSGRIKGIGPVVARKIVDMFGEDTLRVIELEPEKLLQISGIGKKTLQKIVSSYEEEGELREIILWLEEHGISGAYAGRIFASYGSRAMEIMEQNPYQLAADISGIGFTLADQLAQSLGIEKNDRQRLIFGLDFYLQQIVLKGHCCLPEMELINRVARMLGVEKEEVNLALKDSLERERFAYEYMGGENLIYPYYLYQAEREVAERLEEIRDNVEKLPADDAGEIIERWELDCHLKLSLGQKQAIEEMLNTGILVLTGGPGTGKTTVVRGMIAVLEHLGQKVILGAPTGRAAKRLSESTGKKASTMHRLLEATGEINEADNGSIFQRDSEEPLEADAIILD